MQETEHLVLYRPSIVLFLACLLNILIYPQRYPNQEVNKLLDAGIECVINQDYELAKSKFRLLDKEYTELPFGKIYLAVVDITRAYDYGEEINSEYLTKQLDEAFELSEKLIENNPDNIWNYYTAALSTGYKSYFKALNGEWLSAISNGLSSVNYFKDCLERDSTFYESYAALGTYKFWKSRKLEFSEWLPFFSDESEIGIQYLERALDKTTYNRNLAAVSLIWIYIEKENYQRAIQIAESELTANPANRALKWALARAFEAVNPEKAIQLYKEIIISYQSIPNQNHYQEIKLKHIIAQQYAKIGAKNVALRLCNEILSEQKLTENVRKKLSDRLIRVTKLKNELME